MHIVDTPRIGAVITNGRQRAAVAVIGLAMGVNIMDRIAVVKEAHIGEVRILAETLHRCGQSGGLATRARSQFPFAFGRIIVGPTLVLQADLGQIRLPFFQLLRGSINAANAGWAKELITPLIESLVLNSC